MTCYTPLEAWIAPGLTSKGKRQLVFKKPEPGDDQPSIPVPCGQCIGCRLDYSREWAVRIMHESTLYDRNCFITLTYSDDNIPWPPSVNVEHYQAFMKNLRRFIEDHTWNGKEYKRNRSINVWNSRKKGLQKKTLKCYNKVRFYHCGEYGDETRRPHYHAILFGLDFDDKKVRNVRDDIVTFTSHTASSIWGNGHVVLGDVTFDSAAYVSRYITKKINGEMANDHYLTTDPLTGECYWLQPEYATMSRRPGIGHGWYEKYKDMVKRHDSVIINGKEITPPGYYDSLYELEDAMGAFEMKQKRLDEIEDLSEEQLKIKLAIKQAQLKYIKRGL